MKKFFSMAALVLMGAVMTGCTSSDDDSIIDTPQLPVNTSKIVTLTTTVNRDAVATTRALTNQGVKTFAVGEQMAVIYHNGTSMVKAVSHELAAGDISNGGKTATFTFDLETPNKSEAVTYIYPAAMAGDTGVDYSNLDSQDGTLETLARNYDLCTQTGAWNGDNLPSLSLYNQLAILAITLKDNAETPTEITSGITRLALSDGTHSYTIGRSAVAGPIYVAIRPTTSANIEVRATDGTNSYTKSLTGKTYEANNGYNVSWKMQASALPATYNDPEGHEIIDPAVIEWLRLYGFTQADINALGNNAAAKDKLYECYLYNCDFTVAGAGASDVIVTDITRDGDYVKTITVQLTRTAPLGAINGNLYFFADENRIMDESVEFFGDNNNPDFPIAPTTGTVTQTATATINNYLKATTITAEILPFIPDNPEEPMEDPMEDPGEDPCDE